MSLNERSFYFRLRALVLGFIIWVVYRFLSLTWRLKVIEPPELSYRQKNSLPNIFAHFHGDELVLLSLIRKYKIATISSTSKDGEMMTVVIKLAGGISSRGSSTRGGVSALKGLISLCKNGSNSSFAVDGPKGPIYKVKPGVFEFSRLLKSPIFSAGIHCDRSWKFPKSWNKTFLPKPFATIHVVWLGPFGPVLKEQDPRSEELAKSLENQIFDARQQASKLFGESLSSH